MKKPSESSMWAAVCHGPGQALQLEELPIPVPAQGQILVELESCGVCHSDLHLRDADEPLPAELYPLVLGHEGIARVVSYGPQTASRIPVGTRVGLPWLYDSCLECSPCLSGTETFCQQQRARGLHLHGAFAQFALLEQSFATTIPEGIDPLSGAPMLCAGLTSWSALNKTQISPSSSVLIIGAGGLGQYAVLIALARGARVMVIDSDARKLEEAKRLGADVCVLAGPAAGAEVQRQGGADIVLNFAPSPSVWRTIEQSVNPLSEIIVVALIQQPVDLSMMWLIDGGHQVRGSSVGTRLELREFLAFAARHPLGVDIEPVSLAKANDALDRLKRGDVNGRLCIDFTLS